MDKPRTLHLHLGFHKTASTSIQHALHEHPHLLHKSGLSYPVFDDVPIPNHNMALSRFKPKPERYHVHLKAGRSPLQIRAFNQQLQAKMSEALASDGDIVLSSESASLLPQDKIEALICYLKSFGFRIRALAFVRSPREFAASWLQQRIKMGRGFDQRALFTTRSDQIARLRETLGQSITFIPFSTALVHPDGPVGQAFDQFGIRYPEGLQFKASNKSMSNEATRILNFVNLHEPVMAQKVRNPRREPNDDRPIQLLPGRPFAFSQEELNSLSEPLRRENSAIRSLLGEAFGDERSSPLSEFDEQFFLADVAFIEQLDAALLAVPDVVAELVTGFMQSSHMVGDTARELFFARRRSRGLG